MLIPALLGLLAVIVLSLFGEIERELRIQLENASVFSVYVSEFVAGENAATILRKSYEDEIVWSTRYGKDAVRHLRQPLVSAVWDRNQTVPVYSYTSSLDSLVAGVAETDFPVAWLLTTAPSPSRQWVDISLSGKRTLARTAEVPPWIRKGLSVSEAVLVPVEMIEPLLNKGFINHTLANFSSVSQVQRFVVEVAAYYRADKRQVKIVSALEILQNLERITRIQQWVRTWIVVGCGMILALTLGSIAWLEYRQDAYLLALLKSFGSPSVVLLLHMFLENLLLVVIGILSVLLAWNSLYQLAAPQLRRIGLQAASLPVIPTSDVTIILLAGLAGVVLSMVPVAMGLRKPAGLILQ